MRLSTSARGLAEFTERVKREQRDLKTNLPKLIDLQLQHTKRVLVAATPVASTMSKAFRLPNGRVVIKTVAHTTSMKNSWHKQTTGYGGKVYNSAPYAIYLFTGTQPHAIPRAFGYLLPFGTSPTFHPGTQPNAKLIAAFTGEIADARIRFEQFGLTLVGKIAGKAV